MNWFFITIGTALVVALTAAAVGPMFVDWTAYRTTIEANAERFLGTRVSVDGQAQLRLLPSPRIRLTDVRLGREEAPLMEAESVELDVDLAPLLRREVRVLDLRLDRPTVHVRIAENGVLAFPDITADRRFAAIFDVDNVTVESVAVEGMTAVLVDQRNGNRRTVEDVTLTGSARSLRGPFQATGTARLGGVEQRLRIAGGAMEEDGSLALSIRMVPSGRDVALRFEGDARLSPADPSLTGRFIAESLGGRPSSVEGDLALDTAAVELDRARLSYGPETAPLELSGRARYALDDGEPAAVWLEARQIDLDRIHHLAEAGPGEPDPQDLVSAEAPPPHETLDRLLAHLAPVADGLERLADRDLAATVQLDVGTVLAGGSLIRDVSAAARLRFGTLTVERAEALLPGETSVAARGELDGGFFGRLTVRAAQPTLLARWWTGEPLRGAVLAPVLVEADVDVTADAVAAPHLSVRVGDSSASGRARYRRAENDAERATVDLSMSAPSLDVADVAALARLMGAAGVSPAVRADMLLDLSVDRLRLGAVEGSGLDIDADYRGGTLNIDAFAAQDLAGAEVFASGAISDLTGSPVGTIEGTLSLAEGAPLAESLRTLLPASETARRIAAILPALAPGDVTVALAGRPSGSRPDLSMRLSGTLGGTDLTAQATGMPFGEGWTGRPLALSIEATNPDAGDLARQLGLPARGDGGDRAAAMSLDLSGTPGDGLEANARVAAGDDSLAYEGTLRYDGTAALEGRADLAITQLAGLAPFLDRPLPQAGPVRLSATVRGGPAGGVRLADLGGAVGGVSVAGHLTVKPDGINGEVALGEADLERLSTLILGADAWSGSGPDRAWPDTVLSDPLLPGFPVALTVSTDRLWLGERRLREARFDLDLSGERLAVSNLSARAAGGTLEGSLTLERAGSRASLSADLALSDAAVSELVWRRAGRAVATGRLDLSADVSSSGYTVAGLVAGLAGNGRLRVADGRLRQMNAAPFALLARAIESDVTPTDAEARKAFLSHLDAGDLAFDTIEADLDITAGTARIRDATIAADGAVAFENAAVDLDAWRLASDWTLQVPLPDEEMADVGLTFRGPLTAPTRSVDVSALTAWLNLKELERQVEAVEQQNEELAAEARSLGASVELGGPDASGETDGNAATAAPPIPDEEPANAAGEGTGAPAPAADGPEAPRPPAPDEAAARGDEVPEPGDAGAFVLGSSVAEPPLDPGAAVNERAAGTDDAIGALLRSTLDDREDAAADAARNPAGEDTAAPAPGAPATHFRMEPDDAQPVAD